MTPKQKEFIIEKVISQEGIPWKKPFSELGVPRNWNSKRKYTGVNLLLFSALDFPSPFFITPKMAFKENIKVEKGKSLFAVGFFPKFSRESKETPEEFHERKEKGIANYYALFFHTVWNVSQTSLWETLKNEKIEKQVITEPENIIANTSLVFSIIDKGSACCWTEKDPPVIGMPLKDRFSDLEKYYSTLFHELIHATRSKLNRKLSSADNKEKMAAEELVAEIGAWLLCQESGISVNQTENTVAYIQSWKKRIKKYPNILFWAMNEAEKAVSFILKGEK